MILLTTAFIGIIFLTVILLSWALAWGIGKLASIHIPFSYFFWAWVALMLITGISIGYGCFFGRWKLNVTDLEYRHADIPASFEDYKIVHISDLHLGSFDGADDKLQHFVESINALNPDLICFTGDLVTMDPREIPPHINTLRQLRAKDGVVSVLGNHDFLIYNRFDSAAEQPERIGELAAMEREALGWKLLRNGNSVIERGDEHICIIGVDNQHCSNQGFDTISKGDLRAAAEGTSGFRILLSHDPSHWMGEVVPHSGIPLTLSGHTHNGQVSIFGWSPCSLVFTETAGRYDYKGQTLYINSGLGTTVPFRIGARPEVTVITLKGE